MNKISSQITKTLLNISENQFEFTKSLPFKVCKICLYFLQLQGYVFSQYESKPLLLAELNFLANFTQLSAGTFALLQLGDDELTKCVFYLLFVIHASLYAWILFISLTNKNRTHQRPSYGQIHILSLYNFIFINFQWILLTPFQEISIGMIVCGKNSFLISQKHSDCYAEIPIVHYILGILGTLLVSLTGFISIYFYRSYQFNVNDFLRKYRLRNFLTIILHQIIIICYYLNLESLDALKHTLLHMLLAALLYESLSEFPFLFYPESRFYTSLVACNEWLMVIVSIWIFTDIDSKFLWLTLLVFLPLIAALSTVLLDIQNQRLLNGVKAGQFNKNLDTYLEEIYRIASKYYFSVRHKVMFITALQKHITSCKQPLCPCRKDCQRFIDSTNNVNWPLLQNLTQALFKEGLKDAYKAKQYYYYENFSLKFNTFLERYKNNAVLAYGILQDIMMMSQKNQQHGSVAISFYFQNLFLVLTQNAITKVSLSAGNSQLTETEFNLIQDQNALLAGSQKFFKPLKRFLKKSLQLWSNYSQQTFLSEDELLEMLMDVYKAKLELQDRISKYKFVQKPSIFLTRTFLIISISINANFKLIATLQKELTHLMLEEQNDNDALFKSFHFEQKQVISIVSHISPKLKGLIEPKFSPAILSFFQIDPTSDQLKQIEQVIPPQISEIHEYLIDNYVQKGDSKRINNSFRAFAKFGNGFIQEVQIVLNVFFPSNWSEPSHLMMAHVQKKISMPKHTGELQVKRGIILLGKHFQLIGMDQNCFFYMNLLNQKKLPLTDINIFALIPSLGEIMSLYFKKQIAKQQHDLESVEMGQGFDLLCSHFTCHSTQAPDKPLSSKERLKTIQRLSLHQQNSQEVAQSLDIHYTVRQYILNYTVECEEMTLPYYSIDIKFLGQQFNQNQSKQRNKLLADDKLSQEDSNEHIKFIHSDARIKEEHANQQLQSSYASYRSSISFFQILQEFYLNTVVRVNQLYKQYCILQFLLIACFIWPLMIEYLEYNSASLLQANLISENVYTQFLTKLNGIILNQLHMIIVEEYLADSSLYQVQLDQNTILNLTPLQLRNLLKEQALLQINSTQLLLQESQVFSYFDRNEQNYSFSYLSAGQVSEQGVDSLLTFYTILLQQLASLSEILKNTRSQEDLIAIRFALIKNYEPFYQLRLQLDARAKRDSSASHNLIIFLSFGYFFLLVFIGFQFYYVSQQRQQKKRFLKLFQLIDYQTACKELEETEIKLKSLKDFAVWLNLKRFDQISSLFNDQLEQLANLTYKDYNVETKTTKLKSLEQEHKVHIKSYFSMLSILLLALSSLVFTQVFIRSQDDKIFTISTLESRLSDIHFNYSNYILFGEATIIDEMLRSTQTGVMAELSDFSGIKMTEAELNQMKEGLLQGLLLLNQQLEQLDAQRKLFLSENPCNELGCNLAQYQKRIFSTHLLQYFQKGLMAYFTLSLQIIQDIKFQKRSFEEMLTSHDYFVYQFWGLDVVSNIIQSVLENQSKIIDLIVTRTIRRGNEIVYLVNSLCLIIGSFCLIFHQINLRKKNNLARGSLNLIPPQTILQKKLNNMIKKI